MPTLATAWPLTFRAVAEAEPGPAWTALFRRTWPAYRAWYLRDGDAARPDLATCQRMLLRHLPELVPTWQRLVELADGDPLAARMLSLYDPPAYLTGCSQAVDAARPALVRNYDYAPQLLEGVVSGASAVGRGLVGTSDCTWGLLDGMNDAGLAVSLAFGGRRVVGSGFGIPLVVRYLLEVCDTVSQARRVLARLPVHMAYTLTAVDRGGDHFTAYLGPDVAARFVQDPVATNHQGRVEWPEQAAATRSVLRYEAVTAKLNAAPRRGGDRLEELIEQFLEPPVRSTEYSLGFGTLYTAAYRPGEGSVEYRWPGSVWRHTIDGFADGEHRVVLLEPAPCSPKP